LSAVQSDSIAERADNIEIFSSFGFDIDDFEKSAGEKDLLFVTGSLYFISEVRAYLIKT